MNKKLDSLWNATLQDIEKEVSRANFFTLFKQTALVTLDDTSATVAAPSTMVIDLLQKRFLPIIKAALDKNGKGDRQVIFIAKSVSSNKNEEIDFPLFTSVKQEVHTIVGHLPRVRPDFTFEALAVSDSNRLAFESARTVSQKIGKAYNPLFIYGPVGVGKTHLMQAVANEVYAQNPDNKIIYITSEEFTNEVVEAIRNNDTAKMKRRFRSANLLIIDDVQFIAGKDRVQEELFHTFNSLIDNGAQIVLSSDRPPSEIKKLEARLSSRFAGGLTVDIESPDFELRTAILLKKAEKAGFALSIDTAKVIAEKEQDVRSLEGALLRVATFASKDKEITQESVEKSIGQMHKNKPHALHAEDIVDAICSFYQVKPTQLRGPKRDASLVKARQIAMFLLKNELGLTLVEIGNVLGGRDHTTIMHGVDKISSLVEKKAIIFEEIVGIKERLRG